MSGGRSRAGTYLATETAGCAVEKSRLSSDSSDKPFVFNKPVLRSCQRFNPSRPGRVVPLKAGCSQDWLPHSEFRCVFFNLAQVRLPVFDLAILFSPFGGQILQ
jgi:hypothetical protein